MSAFGIVAEAATQLTVTVQPPANVALGAVIPVTVVAVDPSGNQDLTFNGLVTIALAANPGGATLGGTLTVQAVNGVARFTNLTLNHDGSGYTFQVTSGNLAAATTNAFEVLPTQLVVTGAAANHELLCRRQRQLHDHRQGRGRVREYPGQPADLHSTRWRR